MNRVQPTKPKNQMPVPPSAQAEVDVKESEHTITQDTEDLAEEMNADLAEIAPEVATEDDLMLDRITERKNVLRKATPKVQLKDIKVVATQMGVYGGERKIEGDKFTIKSEQEFSTVWMQKI